MQWEQDDIYTPEADQPSPPPEHSQHLSPQQQRRAEHYQKKFEEAYDKYKEQYTDDEELSKKIQSDMAQHTPSMNSQWLELAKEADEEYRAQEPWESAESDLELEIENAELDALPAYQYSMQFGL